MIYTHAAAVVLGLALGFAGAWQVQVWRWRAADADRLEQQQQARRAQEQQADAAGVRFEQGREAIRAQQRVITREVERVVESPVYRDVCLDPDGLRLVAATAAGAASGAGEPAPAVPASAAAP